MAIEKVNIGQELLNVPMGEMIRSMAFAIADSQFELDKASFMSTEHMSGMNILRDLDTGDFLDKYGNPSSDPTKVPVVYDTRIYFGYSKIGGKKIPNKVSALELGFAPTFYQFVDTIIEVKISIKVVETKEETKTKTQEITGGVTQTRDVQTYTGAWGNRTGRDRTSTQTMAAPVNTSYTSKFSFSAEGSSLLRTKLVPVPTPAIFEERVRELVELERADKGVSDEKERLEKKIENVKALKEGGAEGDEINEAKKPIEDRIDALKETLIEGGASEEDAEKNVVDLNTKLNAIQSK